MTSPYQSPQGVQTRIKTITSSQLSLSALNTRCRNRWNHQKESSRSCVSTSPGSLKGAPYKEGQGPSRMKDLTEATLFPCHLLLGIVRISTASQCLQVLRMKAPCAATMGLGAPNCRNVISWLFQPQNLPEQGLYLQSLRKRHKIKRLFQGIYSPR